MLLQDVLHDGVLLRRGAACQHRTPREAHTFGGRRAALFENALRKGARGLDVLDIVHQHQRLERGVAAVAPEAGAFAGGGVKVAIEGGGAVRFQKCRGSPVE